MGRVNISVKLDNTLLKLSSTAHLSHTHLHALPSATHSVSDAHALHQLVDPPTQHEALTSLAQ